MRPGVTLIPARPGEGGRRATTTVPAERPARERELRLQAPAAALACPHLDGASREEAQVCRDEVWPGDEGG